MNLPKTLSITVGATSYLCERRDSVIEPIRQVVPFSQRDGRWANTVYSGGNTFASSGCLVVCVAMIASLGERALEPPEVALHLREAGAFVGALLSRPARIPVAIPWLEWGGVDHWRDRQADLGLIVYEIERSGATICEVKWNPAGPSPQHNNQHFVVVEGCDGNDADIVDPWDGQRKKLSDTSYRLKGWSAARTIHGMRKVRVVT